MMFSGILTTAVAEIDPNPQLPMDDAELLGLVLGIYAVVFTIALVFAAIHYVVLAIGLSAVFRKAGVEPWKAWVPFYNTFVWLQLGGQSGHWLWLSFVGGSIVTSVFLYIGMFRTGIAFGKSTGFLVLGIFLPFVWALILGFGKDEYHPERITAAGYDGPLVGYGAVAPGPAVYRA
jgi:hypothetical protein